jgi:uncharacterized SAM-binding protein YcdF (DUF218 family)
MSTAFFFLSKIAWVLLKPLNSLLILGGAWQVLRWLDWRRAARLSLVLLVVYGGLILATPLPEFSVRSLENRFPQPRVDAGAVAGIIVLGGATDNGVVAEARRQVGLNEAAERLTTAVALHRNFSGLRMIVSGFSARLRPQGWSEAEITRLFFEQQGVDMARVGFEAQSRNTAENAQFTARMIGASELPWLLVTSAAHMPRAVASFRAQGLAVLPYPVDFKTTPDALTWPAGIGRSLGFANVGLREWLGLLVYYVTGRGAELFPAPG